MADFYEALAEVLKKDERFFTQDGVFLRSVVYDAGMRLDEKLLRLLLDDKQIKKHFFTSVKSAMGDITIFDKVKFGWVINNKQFLPDSFTRFKNYIGLVDERESFIANSRDVELVFPYKDCVLEGGQTKEDQKRKEIFYNETLAPDEVDRLLYPKVLVNATKYDKDGQRRIENFSNDDNLIIRGNNLLALSSILKRYENKIKCIYIDPPYNTGADSFGYNDNFNHSSWLVFMKNRLMLARRLLKDNGAIFIQIDHHELGYINVLMDEIFGIENKVQIISVKTASPAGFKTVNPGPIDVTEYILFYTKKKHDFKFKKGYVPVGYNKNYNLVVIKDSDIKKWKFKPIKEVVIETAGFNSEKEAKKQYGDSWKAILQHLIEDYAFKHADNVVSIRDPHKPTEALKELMAKSRTVNYALEYSREDGSKAYIYNGGALAFYSNKMKNVDGEITVTELLSDFWNHISWAGIAKEGGVKLKNGKKPEKLLKQIFEISTDPGDIVLDYHAGSGTTCAVAHKMGLKYIGCEQLDYGDNDIIKRLQNVIAGDQTGISKALKWQGGGSFIYCELAQLNQKFVHRILNVKECKEDAEVENKEFDSIWQDMKKTGFISCRVNLKEINTDAHSFKELTFDEKKRLFITLLDKNQLYINYCDIDDEEYGISEQDKAFSKSFYEEK